jgi:hypothetical protein
MTGLNHFGWRMNRTSFDSLKISIEKSESKLTIYIQITNFVIFQILFEKKFLYSKLNYTLNFKELSLFQYHLLDWQKNCIFYFYDSISMDKIFIFFPPSPYYANPYSGYRSYQI